MLTPFFLIKYEQISSLQFTTCEIGQKLFAEILVSLPPSHRPLNQGFEWPFRCSNGLFQLNWYSVTDPDWRLWHWVKTQQVAMRAVNKSCPVVAQRKENLSEPLIPRLICLWYHKGLLYLRHSTNFLLPPGWIWNKKKWETSAHDLNCLLFGLKNTIRSPL